jgi:hypothetical protein
MDETPFFYINRETQAVYGREAPPHTERRKYRPISESISTMENWAAQYGWEGEVGTAQSPKEGEEPPEKLPEEPDGSEGRTHPYLGGFSR